MKNKLALVVVTALLMLGVGQVPAQKLAKEECSLAVVSRLVSSKQPVCSSKVVQQMASQGHVFEQNQLGMASILIIGPDYSEKELVEGDSVVAANR